MTSRVHITFDEKGEIIEYELAPSVAQRQAEYEYGFRAMMLASTPAIYRALLAGEKVPVERLHPERARQYGLRNLHAA